MKSIKYFLAAIIVSTSLLIITTSVNAQSDPTSLNYIPEISIPNSNFTGGTAVPVGQYVESTTNGVIVGKISSDLIGKYIQAIYNYGLAIVSILAAIVLMGGGLIWLTSGGDSSKINNAKEMIIGSITGMIILFCAWIILNTVNPALLELKPIETVIITKTGIESVICCDPKVGGEIMNITNQGGKRFFTNEPSKAYTSCAGASTKFTSNTIECPDSTYTCEYSADGIASGSFKCVKSDDICCACLIGPFGTPVYAGCTDHVKSKTACENACAASGFGYTTYLYPGTYNCGSRMSYNWCSAPK